MRTRLPLAFVLVASIAAALAVVALALTSLPGGDGEERDDQSGRDAAGPRLVYAQFGPTADRIFTAPAAEPGRRAPVATVEHAEGWGINPAPAMAGSLVAYTVLPPGGPGRRDARAELWLLDVESHARIRLARDADLLVAPVFDREGARLAYRSTGPGGEQRLVLVDLSTRLRRVQHTYEGTLGVFAVGFADDGALLFAQLSSGGTDVYRVTENGDAELLFHASDHIARDWRLSPDGRALSYLSPEMAAERIVHRLRVVELAAPGGQQRAGAGEPASEQFAPVWTPDGGGVTVGREAYPGVSAAAVTFGRGGGEATALAAPARGFDAPLGWSPDGRYLAARSFDGVSSYDPGRESMVVISTDGERRAIAVRMELIFIGWLPSG